MKPLTSREKKIIERLWKKELLGWYSIAKKLRKNALQIRAYCQTLPKQILTKSVKCPHDNCQKQVVINFKRGGTIWHGTCPSCQQVVRYSLTENIPYYDSLKMYKRIQSSKKHPQIIPIKTYSLKKKDWKTIAHIVDYFGKFRVNKTGVSGHSGYTPLIYLAIAKKQSLQAIVVNLLGIRQATRTYRCRISGIGTLLGIIPNIKPYVKIKARALGLMEQYCIERKKDIENARRLTIPYSKKCLSLIKAINKTN